MHPKFRLTIVAVIAAALGLTGGIGTAGAHKRKLPRQTTVAFEDLPGSSGDRISGQVSIGVPQEPPLEGGGYLARSAGLAANCLKGQRVEIKHALTAEGGGGDAATLVATAVTNANGAWETTAYEARAANDLLFDSFHVEVVKKRVKPKNARHKHVCKGAFASRTVFSY
jgi:hypothetical protein